MLEMFPLLTVPSLLFVGSASLAAAQNDYNQCYFAADSVAPQSLLPCLPANETDNGVSWCCFAGHSCVNQACYDAKSGVTYQYGCNDPTYEDPNCPLKGGLDSGKSPWVGLAKCDTANEGQLKYWACNHPDTCGDFCPTEPDRPQQTQSVWPWEIEPLPPFDACDGVTPRVLAMYAPESLGSTGGVPETFTPATGKPSPTRPPVRSSDATPTSVSLTLIASDVSSGATGTPTGTPRAGDEAEAGLSNGAIAGVAVGATLAVVAILAAIFFLIRRRRFRRKNAATHPDAAQEGQGTGTSDEKRNLMVPNTPSTISDGSGIRRPVSDMSSSNATPLGTPKTPASPCYNQGPYSTHAELPDDGRAIHEMPAINERAEMP